MKQSLDSTARALAAFVDSLEKSGFKKSIPAYLQMKHVLLQQRLWADRLSRNELQQHWENIARHSGELHQIIGPFAEIMGELKNIDKIKFQPNAIEEKQAQGEYEKIMNVLSTPQSLSASKLSRLLDIERKTLIEKIEPLINQGIVEKKGWGNGLSYRLRKSNPQNYVRLVK